MSASHRKSRKQLAVALGPVPQIIARIPRPYPPSAEALGVLMTTELFAIWGSILSDSKLQESRGPQSVSSTAIEKLDALILKQTETMGWRLGLSPLVHMRFSEWDHQPTGPALFVQYGKALAKSARRFQKLDLPPIDDPDLYRLKQETVPELRRFLRNLRNAFSRRQQGPSLDEVVDFFQTSISGEGDEFVHLKANKNNWVQFFRANSSAIKSLLHTKRPAPAALFDSWFAWGKGYDPETVRQKISELSRFLRDSRRS